METEPESMILALRQLSSSNQDEQVRAFEVLTRRSRGYLNGVLKSYLNSESDRDDVIGEVFHHAWKVRETLKFDRLNAWFTYLRAIARHRAIDLRRVPSAAFSTDDPEVHELTDLEIQQVDAFVEKVEDTRMLYRVADELFLGVPVDSDERKTVRSLLAAKMLLIDKIHWKTVCEILNSSAEDHERLTRTDIDQVSSSAWVLSQLAYSELFWDNERLCEYLLEQERDVLSPVEDNRLEEERNAIRLRFRYALLLEQVSHRIGGKLKKSELVDLFDRCVARFPFVEIMNVLISSTGNIPGAQERFASRGLWQRLAFQYHCLHELPHQDIFDRTHDAAARAGFQVTMAKLNVALSNGRLFKRMAEYLEARGVEK